MEHTNEKHDAAAVLQKLSRGFLAKKQFAREAEARKAEDERSGVHAPFVPTPLKAIEVLRRDLLVDGDILCDLGCGDGRVLIECSPKLTKGIGVDIQEGPLERARESTRSRMLKSELVWIHGDFRDPRVEALLREEITVCFLFLLPEVVNNLVRYLTRTMRLGTRIVCYTFQITNLYNAGFSEDYEWEPSRVLNVPDLPTGVCKLYEYTITEEAKTAAG